MTDEQKPEGPARNLNRTRQFKSAADIAKAMQMRIAGLTYQVIAKTMGWANKSVAYNACMREMIRLKQEPAQESRTLELLRIDRAQAAIWDQVIKGNHGAIDRFVRLSERRSRILGLDAPTKIAPTNPQGDQPYDPLHLYIPDNQRDPTLTDPIAESKVIS